MDALVAGLVETFRAHAPWTAPALALATFVGATVPLGLLVPLSAFMLAAGTLAGAGLVDGPAVLLAACLGLAAGSALGYEVALVELQSRLDLPVPAGTLDALAGAAAPHHAAYTLRSWEGPVPEDLVAAYVALDAVVDVEAPSGDLDIEPLHADVEVWRHKERESAAQGRRNVSTAAVTADGDVVALTELWANDHEPERLNQWSTIVRRDHRGHRLGVAVKVANHQVAQERFPEARQVVTWNAESNAHMLAVNVDLGFRVVERTWSVQLRLG